MNKEKLKNLLKTSILIAVIILGTKYNVLAAEGDDLQKAIEESNRIGKTIWTIVKIIGYWVCAVYAAKDIIKELTQGDLKDVIKVVTKYAFGFALLAFFLKILNFILGLSN